MFVPTSHSAKTLARAVPPDPRVAAEPMTAFSQPQVSRAARIRKWVLRLAPLVLLAAASFVLWREFRHLSWGAVAQAMAAWGEGRILLALVLSAVSFLLMGVVEWLGARWAGARLPWGPALAGSFLANAIAHAIGANLLVSAAVRARLYSRFGVSLTQVAATTLFGGFSFAVGLTTLGGAGLLFSAPEQIAAIAVPLPLARAAGATMLAGVAIYVGLCLVARAPLRLFRHSITLPTAREALAQVVVGVLDNAVAAAIIWILLPAGAVAYQSFVGAYAAATVAGLISSVPAGAGVFEGSISTLLPRADAAPLAAAFLGYRLAYYLAPLTVASLALAGDTAWHSRRKVG